MFWATFLLLAISTGKLVLKADYSEKNTIRKSH